MRKVSTIWILALGVIAAVALLQIQRVFDISPKRGFVLSGENAADGLEKVNSIDAKFAKRDLDSYFDAIPTANVNAFHEPELQGNPNYGGVEDQTRRHLRSRDATSDLLDYYSKVPTHNVNAFHEPTLASSKIDGRSSNHVRVKFSASKARAELSDYFIKIPTHEGNAFHEPAISQNTQQQGLRGTPLIPQYNSVMHRRFRKGMAAEDARREMSSYFMQIPTKNVAADHTVRHLSQPSLNLAKTLEAAAQVLIFHDMITTLSNT